MGWRKPNTLIWRYCIVAIALAIPFLIWMVQSPTMANSYLKQLERLGFAAFAAFYLVNMFTEHLLLHGVVLGLARSDGHWPSAVPLGASGRGVRGALQWLGLGAPSAAHGSGRLSTWLGVAPGCIGPMLFSALLFGMVHLGKDSRELILSFPGGLAQSYMAYRSNSWFTPFLIHLGTASAALAMMVLL